MNEKPADLERVFSLTVCGMGLVVACVDYFFHFEAAVLTALVLVVAVLATVGAGIENVLLSTHNEALRQQQQWNAALWAANHPMDEP